MSGNLSTLNRAFTQNTSSALSLENLFLVNLKQFSCDLATQLQPKNSSQRPISVSEDDGQIDNIEQMFQPIFTKLREQELPLTAKELLLAVAACLKKQTIYQHSPTNARNLDFSSSSPNPKTFSTISHWFWPSIPQLVMVFQFIEANYNKILSISDIATSVGYSETYLCSLVKSQTGRTIHNWIVERRMVLARYELLTTNKPVNKIAETVGYEDPGYFIRHFRKLHHKSPKVWRNIRRTQNCIHPFNRCALIGMQIVN